MSEVVQPEIMYHPVILDLSIHVYNTKYGQSIEVFLKDDLVMKWNDDEADDLDNKINWHNRISEIFNIGISLGLDAKLAKPIIITDIHK